ncbi:MAG: rhodanese-like domain-containing protein [Aquabacterium sp.]|uniref:rhodanese-like domain-containing protein n=1 Tax=Aquabacterium sp. TaxID=1872578 RepID=UPI00271E15B9|nr:rhodanese-like domain-containing protein [Aquabacterium sp.]MDO9004197.1 rhodanese-like domain-containing protein [Aquabacterium sp.]
MSYLLENWYWLVAALASGGLLMWPQIKGGANAGLTPANAVHLINREKAQVIDVCDAAEFAAGHVVGAKNIPLDTLTDKVKGLPGNKTTPLVVVCATGARSAKAVAQLKTMGYEKAQVLAGGLKAWREANLPVEKTA